MAIPPIPLGGVRPQPAIPQTEDDYLAALFQLDQEQAAQPPDPTFSGGATPGFLERFGTALQGGVPQAPGAVGSFISGLAGSLAGQGQKVAAQRAQFEQTMEARRRERDAENLRVSREKRAALWQQLNDLRKDERAAAREAAGRKTPQQLQDEEYNKRLGQNRADKEVPNPRETTPKPPTEFQAKARGYYNQSLKAVEVVAKDGLEDRIAGSNFYDQSTLNAPRVLQGPDVKAYVDGIQQFTLALNRLQSGAAIAPTEFSRVAKLYFVQPGDDATDLARKRILRQQVLDDLLEQGGGPRDAAPPNPRAGETSTAGTAENPRAAEAAPAFVAPPTWKRLR